MTILDDANNFEDHFDYSVILYYWTEVLTFDILQGRYILVLEMLICCVWCAGRLPRMETFEESLWSSV
jgi:hypothetical protein